MGYCEDNESMLLKTHDGSEFEAYVAGPEDAERAVLMIHDWWGVLDYNRTWADRFADLGYRAMVIDLYDGEQARNAEEAGDMMRSVDQDEADAKLLSALEYLKAGGRPVGALGWSFGGRQAMQAALLDPEAVRATVLLYCRMVTEVDELRRLGGPVLAIYAETERTWPEKMEKFTQAMAEAGQAVESLSFPGAHGFANPGSERYHEAYAESAFAAARDFLDRALGRSV